MVINLEECYYMEGVRNLDINIYEEDWEYLSESYFCWFCFIEIYMQFE